MLQLDAANATQAGHDFDINYRNTRIDEVRCQGFKPGGVLVGRCILQPTAVNCAVALQAETAWKAAAVQLQALTETHGGVLHQLKEAQERTQLAEQETIEVSRLAHFSLSGTLSDVLAGSARWQILQKRCPDVHMGNMYGSPEYNIHI